MSNAAACFGKRRVNMRDQRICLLADAPEMGERHQGSQGWWWDMKATWRKTVEVA